jgi:G:T/U-mismatch repair DNA glycosylase
MSCVKHRFFNYKINPNTETLIVGTFNPESEENQAEFFYGRSRNYLWKLLPLAYQEPELKNATKEKKIDFIGDKKIDFIDLIIEVVVDEGEESNYYDGYIDSRVSQWNNIIDEIKRLDNIKRVCFTRKTYSDIPNMKKRVIEIENYCKNNNIIFQALPTPARFHNDKKQHKWTSFLNKE